MNRSQWVSLSICLPMMFAVFAQSARAQKPPDTPPMTVQETVEVARIIIDAHVNDASHVITDLRPEDFRVRVDGKDAKIESVEWVSELPLEEVTTDLNTGDVERETINPPGRLFVCFVQTDFGRNGPRILGEMIVIAKFHEFVEMLQPDDRVAILSFDSHLKLRLDFTSDRQKLEKVFPTVLLIDEPAPDESDESPSLGELLDEEEMRNTATSEKALILVARALGQISGPKTMVLFGWGLGETQGGHITPLMKRGAAEFAAARVTIYALNFGLGGQLSRGLIQMAGDTGGFYHAVGDDSRVIDKFAEGMRVDLQGHYEIEVRNPAPGVPGTLHNIEVNVTRRGAIVRAKKTVVER